MNFLKRLLGGPSAKALAHAHEQAEVARLRGLNREPPPGEGWRVGDQDSEGKWTVWNGPRPIASFWDENDAVNWARGKNVDRPARPAPVMRDDGKYCVNCGSHETDASIKARGYANCCPERYVIAEAWQITDGKLATGQFHLWRPAVGLETVTDDSWPDRTAAQHEADHRNLLAHRAIPVARPDLAEFLNVPVPAGLKVTVGPRKHPTLGNWWTFDASGPVKGYTRKSNAQAAADRANNG